MTSKQFFLRTLSLALGLSAAVAAVDWRLNFYGVFGGVRGQRRTVISDEPRTKCLFAYNYIPSNFDALLVGSSISSNIDPTRVHGFRMYNASLCGANMTEERILAGRCLERGRFKLMLVCFNPYLMKNHGVKRGGMEARDYWGALGSPQLFGDYLGAAAIRHGLLRQRFFPEGRTAMEPPHDAPVDADLALAGLLRRTEGQSRSFYVDPEAVRDVLELFGLARRVGAKIAVFFPPVYQPAYLAFRPAYLDFESAMRALLAPGENVLDLNDGSRSGLCGDPKSFYDGVHLSAAGADQTADVLGAWLQSAPEAR